MVVPGRAAAFSATLLDGRDGFPEPRGELRGERPGDSLWRSECVCLWNLGESAICPRGGSCKAQVCQKERNGVVSGAKGKHCDPKIPQTKKPTGHLQPFFQPSTSLHPSWGLRGTQDLAGILFFTTLTAL